MATTVENFGPCEVDPLPSSRVATLHKDDFKAYLDVNLEWGDNCLSLPTPGTGMYEAMFQMSEAVGYKIGDPLRYAQFLIHPSELRLSIIFSGFEGSFCREHTV